MITVWCAVRECTRDYALLVALRSPFGDAASVRKMALFRFVKGINSFLYWFFRPTTSSTWTEQDILELVFHRCFTSSSVGDMSFLSNVSLQTVVDYFQHCQCTVGKVRESEHKFVGTYEQPIEVDESMIAGSAKFKKCQHLAGDGP